MKMTSLRTALLASAALVTLVSTSTTASAQTYVRVQVGAPPPPVVVERAWASPYRTAVWIPGHHEWVRGRWVWVGGYYSYPPTRHPHANWDAGHYRNGYWYPGHWVY